jgi:mono/diheme cytochrome c family protein
MTSFAAIRSCPLALAVVCLALGSARAAGPERKVDYNRDVRPILSENCFACHGPDAKQRKARLRLDTKQGQLAEVRNGNYAVAPGKPDESELLVRVTEDDSLRRMPPAKTGKHLTPEQIDVLKRWVAEGAKWSAHWAFVAPTRPPLPKVKDAAWPREPIDRFLLARLEAKGLRPSREADKVTLIRRLTLDLTGLPPTPADVDAFLADTSPEAYERVVDRLLGSSRHGEHMARYWLDAARYGDTHGLHLDNYREMWPFRDWVIGAFNRNLPYDRFLTEQLAGDLLPNATLDQIVASGFNRCHVTTSEGGSIEEEVYVRNVVDRVDTTGTVFLGLTVGCARCHDHKYDPVRQKDFYQLFAFFNSLDEKPLDGNAARYPPVALVPAPEQKAKLTQLDRKAAEVRRAIAEAAAKVRYDEGQDGKAAEQAKRAEYVWVDDALPPGAVAAGPAGVNAKWEFVGGPQHPVLSGKTSVRRTASELGQVALEKASPGLRVGQGDELFAFVYLDPSQPPRELMLQWHTDGWKHRAFWGENLIPWGKDGSGERRKIGPLPPAGKWVRLEVEAAKVGLKPGAVITGLAFTQHGGTVYWDRAGIVTATPQGGSAFETLSAWVRAQRAQGGAGLPADIQAIVKAERDKRTEAQKKQLLEYFIANAYSKAKATFEPLRRQLADVEKERAAVEKQVPATLVSKERPQPRPAYVLKRGEYDQRGEPVGRELPAFLPPLPAGAPKDRLGVARWLLTPEHPLTARVEVNRLWQQVFGTGLVKTAEDFGAQGEPPSHPELLDWLAVQFREDGWDVKRMMKRLVMSAAYRQSSRVTADRLAKDPDNRLLSRGPRFRLDAEVLRDQALFVSGLLAEKVGGPSVKPPQPAGLWEAVGYVTSNTARFTADTGHEKVHRRSLYTFWKRTAAPPQMTAFDAPSRESCTVRRERTNTPLQALLLLNETQYVEASRALAQRALKEGGPRAEDRLAYLFRLATARRPDAEELAELTSAYRDHLEGYRKDAEAARKLITVGESKPDAKLDAAELAALTMVANLVLNLDEVINKG